MTIYGVILAAGKGERLRPYTLYVPKPIMPMPDGRLVIEDAIARLMEVKPAKIYVVVHYMAGLVEDTVAKLNKAYGGLLEVTKHDRLLGTAGHLYFLNNIVDDGDLVVVENGDVVLRANMVEALRNHLDKGLDMTIIGYPAEVKLRFGVIKVGEGGLVESWDEKPTLRFIVSTGNYIVKGRLIRLLKGEYVDMNDFVNSVIRSGGKVGVYMAEEFIDIGTVDDYLGLWCRGM